jgi:hypothetical protein
VKEIGLTKGAVALVDDEDFEYLSQWTWRLTSAYGKPYACRTQKAAVDGIFKPRCYFMHRMILGLTFGDKLHGDHINHNTLDNRRCNLRIATSSENQRNAQKHKEKSSKYKGVSWSKRANRWLVHITIERQQVYVGSFTAEIEAAKAYNDAALEAFGNFASLNDAPLDTHISSVYIGIITPTQN